MDGLELLKNLKANNSNTECIIVSGQHESSAPKILEAIRVGAVAVSYTHLTLPTKRIV